MLRHSLPLWAVRPPAEAEIYAPEFPAGLEWLNVAFLRMNTLMGRGAVLVEFWDFARVNSLRTLPYLKEWHARYARRRPARDRRAHARLLVRARPRHGRARGRAARDPVPGAARPRLRDLARVRQQGLAGPLPVRPHRQAGAHPLRRGRVRGHRARDRRVPRHRRGADGSRCAPRTCPASCSSRRPPTSRCRPSATGSSSCATGPTARTGSRQPTRARRRASSSAPAPPTRCCPAAGVEPGLYERDGTVEAESPACACTACSSRLSPPAPSGSPSGA